MNIDLLVRMANQIAAYFDSEPEAETAIAGIANHLQRFWDPRMRQALYAHVQAGGAGVSESVRQAALRAAPLQQE